MVDRIFPIYGPISAAVILRLNELNGLPATIYRLGKYSYIITIYDPTYRLIDARPVSVLVEFPAIYYRPPTPFLPAPPVAHHVTPRATPLPSEFADLDPSSIISYSPDTVYIGVTGFSSVTGFGAASRMRPMMDSNDSPSNAR